MRLVTIRGSSSLASPGDGKALRRGVSSRMQHLVDYAGRKSAHSLILRDMLMLENQVPLFLLLKAIDVGTRTADPSERGDLLEEPSQHGAQHGLWRR